MILSEYKLNLSWELPNELLNPAPVIPDPPETPESLKSQYNFYKRMRTEATLVDCNIVAEGCEIPVHKLVLASRSAVFEAMLKQDMKEARSNEIRLEDTTKIAAEAMIDFIYSNEFPKERYSVDEMCQVLALAHRFGLEGLVQHCTKALGSKITIDNIETVACLAYNFDILPLVMYCKWFCGNNDIYEDILSQGSRESDSQQLTLSPQKRKRVVDDNEEESSDTKKRRLQREEEKDRSETT